MYNLIKYSDTYSKTSGSFWQYYRDEAVLDNNNNIIDFPADNNNCASFKFKQQITGQTGNGGIIVCRNTWLGNTIIIFVI